MAAPSAGWPVAERLQALRVACEGGADAAEGLQQAPLSPQRLSGGSPADAPEPPREPEPPWADAGDAPPRPSPAAGDSLGRGGGEAAGPRAAEAPPEGGGGGGRRSPSPGPRGAPGGRDGGLGGQAGGEEGGEAPPEESPAASRAERAGAGGARPESSSGSDSEADTDTSSSLSPSCSPILSDGDDDQQNKNESNSATKKKSELTKQEAVAVEDVMIILPESVKLMPFGKVSSIIEHLVIIESEKGLPPVNEGTVVFKEDRHSLGKVFEVFGPVSHPFYVVQFNSPEHIQSKDINIKDAVCFAPAVESFTQYIFPEKLKQEKGSDASWKNDEEPPPEALEFSDDEKERTAKFHKKSQNIKRKKLRSQQNDSNINGPNYQPRHQPPSEYSRGYCRGQPATGFLWGRSPPVAPFPRFPRQHNVTPQYYSSDYAQLQKLPTFCQQQRQESMRRHPYSFPPPSFETVGNNAHFPPPSPSVDWGWPHPRPQNTYEPLLAMLSLPPPPPPPPPPPTPNTGSST